jgi:phage terminase small subunit
MPQEQGGKKIMKLTMKQEKFSVEFVKNGGNASKAYRATYNASKMKPETVWRKAAELMGNGKVAARINALRMELNRKLEISAENALKEIAKIAFFDIRKLFDETGSLIPIHKLEEDAAAAIASLDVVTKMNGEHSVCIVKIKLWDKNAALEKLGKHLKLFTDKLEHSTDDSLARLLREIDGKTSILPRLPLKT